VACRSELQADLLGQARQRIGGRRQVGEGEPWHGAVVASGPAPDQLAREATLADASRSGDREDPSFAGTEHGLELSELHDATDERIARGRGAWRRRRARQGRAQGFERRREVRRELLPDTAAKLLEHL